MISNSLRFIGAVFTNAFHWVNDLISLSLWLVFFIIRFLSSLRFFLSLRLLTLFGLLNFSRVLALPTDDLLAGVFNWQIYRLLRVVSIVFIVFLVNGLSFYFSLTCGVSIGKLVFFKDRLNARTLERFLELLLNFLFHSIVTFIDRCVATLTLILLLGIVVLVFGHLGFLLHSAYINVF